jgi:hypothetical protein
VVVVVFVVGVVVVIVFVVGVVIQYARRAE